MTTTGFTPTTAVPSRTGTKRLAVSGTYSTGKTTTTIALSHLTGIPRTHARTMREILADVLPDKRLEECTASELIQLGIRRFTERAVHESHLAGGFLSDGSSLHEWVYGKVRVRAGIHPTDGYEAGEAAPDFYEEVIDGMGAVLKDHARRAYDVFIHLPVEFDLVADGHRPVSERFREMSDELLRGTLDELRIPYHVVGGTIEQRLATIVDIFGLPALMSLERAVELARSETADGYRQVSAAAARRSA
ncbi:AAA family ATPase [Streptomyces regalis]|uniref:ATP/GTP-binding protein n=1 Tax=Streptomyces regalis TaxID=68262 RepID=A0A101JSJ4_9ACTN|nr:AAA family ATPase [Streptomyces regalis]KUL32206.1 ATP/GTP-binding protein [Streptomyces regalis]